MRATRITGSLALIFGLALLLSNGAHAQTNSPAPAVVTTTTNQVAMTNAPVTPADLSQGTSDIVKLSRAGKKDSVLIFYANNAGLRYHLSADDIIYLKAIGISQQVVTAMLEADKEQQKAVVVQPDLPSAAVPPTQGLATSDPVYQEPALNNEAQYVPSPVYPDYSAYPGYYGSFDNTEHHNGQVSVAIGIGVGADVRFGGFYRGGGHFGGRR
jgi:hypothetical protein